MLAEERFVRDLPIVTERLPPAPPDRGVTTTRSPVDAGANIGAGSPGVAMAIPESPPVAPPKPAAAVDANAFLSFVDGVSAQEREDILYSVQLASRGASAAHDRFKASEAWYGKYIEILERLGWTSEQFAFAKYAQSEGELRMDQAALAVIAAIATQNQLTVLNQSLNALKELAENDGAIRLFDFHTTAQASGNFQIGAVQKSANGALSLALGAFYFQSDDRRRRFLFFARGALEVRFWTAARKLTFNTEHYARQRQAVKEKLGASAHDYIADLEIA